MNSGTRDARPDAPRPSAPRLGALSSTTSAAPSDRFGALPSRRFVGASKNPRRMPPACFLLFAFDAAAAGSGVGLGLSEAASNALYEPAALNIGDVSHRARKRFSRVRDARSKRDPLTCFHAEPGKLLRDVRQRRRCICIASARARVAVSHSVASWFESSCRPRPRASLTVLLIRARRHPSPTRPNARRDSPDSQIANFGQKTRRKVTPVHQYPDRYVQSTGACIMH